MTFKGPFQPQLVYDSRIYLSSSFQMIFLFLLGRDTCFGDVPMWISRTGQNKIPYIAGLLLTKDIIRLCTGAVRCLAPHPTPLSWSSDCIPFWCQAAGYLQEATQAQLTGVSFKDPPQTTRVQKCSETAALKGLSCGPQVLSADSCLLHTCFHCTFHLLAQAKLFPQPRPHHAWLY